jgi:hypothetical protein
MKKLLLIFFFVSGFSFAETAKTLSSKVDMEFEPTPDAKGYQLEVRQGEHVVLTKESDQPKYILELEPGRYEIKTRAKDKRGVYGVWSESDSIEVTSPGLQLRPENSVVKAMDPKNPYEPLKLQWPEMPLATGYQVKIKDKNGKIVGDKQVEQAHTEISLVPGEYSYTVLVMYADGQLSPPSEFEPKIQIKATEIPAPKVEWKGNKKGQKIARWQVPAGIQIVNKLEYSAYLSEQWTLVKDKFEKPEIITNHLRPPGRYRLTLQAMAEGWTSGPSTVEEFEVKPIETDLEDDN